jgi:putative transposase
MAVSDIVPVPSAQFEETLASASPDLLPAMIREFAQRTMDADVDVAWNAGYGEVTPDRVNSRNGYRRREWDIRAGTIELAIPKLRYGSSRTTKWTESRRYMGLEILAACRKAARPGMGQNLPSEAGLTVETIPA